MADNRTASHREVKGKLIELYDELLAHEGFGEFRAEFRILKRGQKEVILHCGKQYRYVVDFQPPPNPALAHTASVPGEGAPDCAPTEVAP